MEIESLTKSVLCGVLSTGVALTYAYIGSTSHLELAAHAPEQEFQNYVPEDPKLWNYYTIVDVKSEVSEQIQVIHDFANTLIDNLEDLDPKFSETVDKYFWDLA